MKIAYITAHAPWGRGETFVLDEMLAIVELGVDLIIVPRNPPKEVFHGEAQRLLDQAIWLPLLNWQIFASFLRMLLLKPHLWGVLGTMVRYSRSLKVRAKNLSVIPKAVFVASLLKAKGVEHVHAHWGSTTATMALVISELTGIPWSFTLHRWDIAENNMLKLKVKQSAFARCIAEDGRREVLSIVGEKYSNEVKVLHMGVRVPEQLLARTFAAKSVFVLACPANFVPKKGHRFLVEACALLIKRGIKNFQCLLIGDGPLERKIQQQIAELSVEYFGSLTGRLPHGDLLKMYADGRVDVVVLPSIVTLEGEKEGIPVALMDAMAYGLPVISTDTGGIPELLSDGAGIMVEEKNPEQLAEAIRNLLENPELRYKIGKKGYQRVMKEFNISTNVARLLETIKGLTQNKHLTEYLEVR